jgi:hypothetical protein
MSPAKVHYRIVKHPFAALMQEARLDSYELNGNDLILGVQGLQIIASELLKRDGKIFERVECTHISMQLFFSQVTELNLKNPGFFTSLEKYPLDDLSRIIAYLYTWQKPAKSEIFYIFGLRGTADADLNFAAKRVTYKKGNSGTPFILERAWSPSPPMPARIVPQPNHLYRQFGGDPITIKIGDRVHHRKLFVGGVYIQPDHRPQVDVVLNVGEEPSKWTRGQPTCPSDRWDNKGEGSKGMSPEIIKEEANWVIERLQKDQRVLVHCAAGMNRSTTICCAVLMLLEGLTADEALNRVHEHHPWAKPDSHHWIALRWLGKNR